jgi:hypothetical protein
MLYDNFPKYLDDILLSFSNDLNNNVLHIYEVAAFENGCFFLALNFL